MNPELKAKIDRINSMDISREMKTALFGKLMEGVKAQYPPPTQPGLMDGFAMEGITDPGTSTPLIKELSSRPNENDTSGGLLGSLKKYGGAGLDKFRQLQEFMGSPATGVDKYFGITPKPDPRSIPPRPTVSRGPFESPDPTVPRPMPNTYFGQPVVPSEEPFKPMAQRWETATKKAFPMGSMNAVSPLPPEQNRAAIRAALPGPQGLVATGGYPPRGMESGIGPKKTPLGGIPGAEFRDPATFPQQPQAQPSLFPDGRPMPLGAGVGGVVDAQRAKQQQMQQAQQQEKIKQQQMDKSGRFGMSGFFDKLFNDPSRMAMLQGGLSMLDPGSYYDAQGFSSPWTGLRAGMGAAGKGYQDVTKQQREERESEADVALAGAKSLKALGESENAGAVSRAKYGTTVKTPEGAFYIDGWQRALDIEGGMGKGDAMKKNAYRIGSSQFQEKMKQSQAQSDASIRMIEEVLGTKGDPTKPGMIDWNTVGMPGAISGVGEAIGSWLGTGTPMESTKLQLAADWIKAMTWRDLVGSGQISKYNYNRLETMLGVRGFLDSPDSVRIKYQEAMDFLKDKRQKPGTYLTGNQKISGVAAPDLSVLGSMGNTFSPVGGLSEAEEREAAPYF